MNARRAANVKVLLVAGITCAALAVPSLVFGQSGTSTSCGSLVTWIDNSTTSEPIADCDDPFAATTIDEDVVVYTLGTTTIQAGTTLELPELPQTYQLSYQEEPDSGLAYTQLYRHRDNDLVQIPDESTVDTQQSRFTFHATGTYSLVHTVPEVFQQVERTPRWLPDWLWPRTAHAQLGTPKVHVTTFQVTLASPPEPEPEPEPTGASSVLFLPGIQASRLHSSEDVSTGWFGGYTAGDRVWEPERNDDVRMLEMTADGDSVYDLYAGSVIDNVDFDRIPILSHNRGDIYGSFIDFLDRQVSNGTIAQWYPYAYDWRYSVFDVVEDGVKVDANGRRESLTDTVEGLANTSKTGKVTIVAHSNGGLLAKALISKLEEMGQSDLVDAVVFVGVPQIGTPKALGTLLHGYDQERGWGYVVDDSLARETLRNFPGTYQLLPTERYLNSAKLPVIRFDDSFQNEMYRDQYGSGIDAWSEYQDFLNGGSATDTNRRTDGELHVPSLANDQLMQEAFAQHRATLADWQAPESVRVVEFVGVGVATPHRLLYERDTERVCPLVGPSVLCQTVETVRPFLTFSLLGDKTVMGNSAGAYRGDKELYYFDLESISNRSELEFNHSNFTETDQLQRMLTTLTLSTSTPTTLPEHVSVDLFGFQDVYSIERIASPVHISTEDAEGNVTGVVPDGDEWTLRNEIPGSQYFTMGGVKYLITPKELDRTTTLYGYKDGSYTYTYSELDLEGTERITTVRQATTTADMRATYTVTAGERSPVTIDWEDNGTEDGILEWSGQYSSLTATPSTSSPETASSTEVAAADTPERQSSSATRVRVPSPQVAGVATDTPSNEERTELWRALQQLQAVLAQLAKQYD